jgi:hypothetical protein
MLKQNLDLVEDKNTREALKFVHQEGFGNPIVLGSAPTADEPLLAANEWGIHSDTVYIRVGQTIYVISPDSTISIT